MDVRLFELKALGHRWEYGTETLAIAAGIADIHLPLDFRFIKVEHRNQIITFGAVTLFTDMRLRQLHVLVLHESLGRNIRPLRQPGFRQYGRKQYRYSCQRRL